MKDNIVDFQRIRRDLGAHSTDVANDAVYSDKKKTPRFFYLMTPVRYLLAASLYLVVVIPLGILAGFRFLTYRKLKNQSIPLSTPYAT